jgi:hypothetical protein
LRHVSNPHDLMYPTAGSDEEFSSEAEFNLRVDRWLGRCTP